MKIPSIRDVAHDLRLINKEEFSYIDVRLQVTPDGWYIHSGDASYDQDHRGFWGSSSVPGSGRRFNSEDVARDLISQIREDLAQR